MFPGDVERDHKNDHDTPKLDPERMEATKFAVLEARSYTTRLFRDIIEDGLSRWRTGNYTIELADCIRLALDAAQHAHTTTTKEGNDDAVPADGSTADPG